jgi:hypothetical protein
MRWTALVMGGLLWGCTHARAGRAPDAAVDAPIAVAIDAAAATDAPADAPAEAAPPIDADCHQDCFWDCFGGSQCANGKIYQFIVGPGECCHYSDWPGPEKACTGIGYPCASGTCATPDPRYQQCLALIGRRSDFTYRDAERWELWCTDGAPKMPGAPCADDGDCRPAADGIGRLRCDAGTHTCVAEARPAPPADYGASCGLGANDVSRLGEGVVWQAPNCALCQVMRSDDGCLRQGCTMACTYDEDCPTGSICLCAAAGSLVSSYCAAATDRDTAAGRAAGLPACP